MSILAAIFKELQSLDFEFLQALKLRLLVVKVLFESLQLGLCISQSFSLVLKLTFVLDFLHEVKGVKVLVIEIALDHDFRF